MLTLILDSTSATLVLSPHTSRTIEMIYILVLTSNFFVLLELAKGMSLQLASVRGFLDIVVDVFWVVNWFFQLSLNSYGFTHIYIFRLIWFFSILDIHYFSLPHITCFNKLFSVCLIYVRLMVSLGSLVILGSVLHIRGRLGAWKTWYQSIMFKIPMVSKRSNK